MADTDRREFLKSGIKVLGVCACAGGLATMLNSCEFYKELQPSWLGITKEINIDKDIDFAASGIKKDYFDKYIGYGVKIRIPDVNYGIPLVLVRKSKDEIMCFSTLCTHDNCFGDDISVPRGYFDRPGMEGYRLIQCNCHGSHFDPWQNGKAVEGPAEKPLKQFRTEYDNSTRILKIFF